MIRADCLPLPAAMVGRPVERRGFPVPWFASKIDGEWDLRFAPVERRAEAIRRRVCWVSGEPLGRHASFVVTPMTALIALTREPPMRREVGLWSLRVCPFLSRPQAKRSKGTIAGVTVEPDPGKRTSAISGLWTCTDYALTDNGLFRLGLPTDCQWFAEGKPATRAAVAAEMHEGIPQVHAGLEKMDAQVEMQRLRRTADWLLEVNGSQPFLGG